MTTRTDAGPSIVGLAVRVILTAVGSACLIVGAFLAWVDGIDGTDLDIRAYWTTHFKTAGSFVATVGFSVIVLGLLALVGLATGSGWLTRLAGALAIVAVVLLGIELYRSAADDRLQIGAWLALAGGVLTLVAGFIGMWGSPDGSSSASTVVVNS